MRNWAKNFLYLILIVFFFSGSIFCGIGIIESLNEVNINLVYFIFNWYKLVDETLLVNNSLFLLFIGSFSWTVVIFYFQRIKTTQYRSILKSISVFFIFWLNLIIFTWLAGLSLYRSFWFIVHIFFVSWVYIGLNCSVIVILISLSSRLKSKIFAVFQRLDNLKFIHVTEKLEPAFLMFIQVILGIYLSIADITVPTIFHGHAVLTSIMLIVFTGIATDLLFLIKDYYIRIPEEEERITRNKVKLILIQTKRIIAKKIIRNPEKVFELIIESLERTIKYYAKIQKNEEDKILLKDLERSLIQVHEKRGNMYNSRALRSYKKSILDDAQNEWNLALNDFQLCLEQSKLGSYSLEYCEQRILDIKDILTKIELEIILFDTDEELNQVKTSRKLLKKDLPKAIELINKIILSYSEAKEKTDQSNELKEIKEKLASRIQETQLFRSQLQDKMDESIGLMEIPAILNERDRDSILSIIREYEFIGGQIRFKVAIINNTSYTFTNLRLAFNLPDALKWIIHEPKYERKGDSILISKLGAHEKHAVSLYLEPINCMESSVNVTVSFFDAKDKPHAVPMKPKMIAISCPIFFTEDEANLARVKSLRRSLANRDKKVFPIANPEKGASIFSSILLVLGKFDIKLVFREFDEEINFGEAWFYGITKVKKNRIIPHVMLDTENKVLEFEVAGDDAEQITSFLAEVSDRVRRKLIHDKVIKPEEKFFDMRITVMSNFCPYCYTLISDDLVQQFLQGDSIKCKNCYANINLDER